jgi:predicted nucleotidyltransferase
MGTVLRALEQEMTRAPDDVTIGTLCKGMARIKARVPSSRWYLFGSITTAKRPVRDIDLLVVCETTADCATVRADLASIYTQFPIHLLLMTPSEEAEVKFIDGERAIEVTPGRAAPAQHAT